MYRVTQMNSGTSQVIRNMQSCLSGGGTSSVVYVQCLCVLRKRFVFAPWPRARAPCCMLASPPAPAPRAAPCLPTCPLPPGPSCPNLPPRPTLAARPAFGVCLVGCAVYCVSSLGLTHVLVLVRARSLRASPTSSWSWSCRGRVGAVVAVCGCGCGCTLHVRAYAVRGTYAVRTCARAPRCGCVWLLWLALCGGVGLAGGRRPRAITRTW
mmetsp:Transcript_5754/g.19073  ORF Transcript_5754/g.19073 Transcript_5754/m.19073 type:complete len:210 (+) Transcript_5754:2849-3478(+)